MTILGIIGVIIAGLNWLSIGLLQYDFIAGFFGTQASIFSRLIYIAIGVCTFIFIFSLIKNKGKVVLIKRRSARREIDDFEPSTNNNRIEHDLSD